MEKNKVVSFYTLGCKVNQYESNAMEQKFIENGYSAAKSSDIADIYVVNTCSVTNVAERKSRQMMRRAKQINPNAIIVVCGCYAQVAKEEIEKMPEVDIVIGINEKNNIVNIVEEFIKEKEKITLVEDVSNQKEFLDFGSTTYTEKNRAVIKVQDGCNMFCSYCIIPYARGRIRSRQIARVVEEVENIAKEDIKEVVVTGIHVASYGKDLEEDVGLIDLLEEINKVKGIERIRLSSLEPTIITKDFLDRLIKLEKICDHFHLSLQSGCDKTLKAMNRKYDTKIYREVVDLIRKYYPNAAITTDIIVGFPGETDEDFEECYKFAEEIKFYMMHVFKYSPRKGTPAAKRDDQIDGNIKEERSNRLIELSSKLQNEYNEMYVGKEVKVLIEELEDGYFKGHTTNYIEVFAKGKEEKDYINSIVNVKIKNADIENRVIIGEICN